MSWANIKIGSYKAKIRPLAIQLPKLVDCDKEGNEVKKIQLQRAEYKHIRVKDSKEIDKKDVYKGYKGKVYRKMSKTTEIEKYEKIQISKARDLNVEKNYQVVCSKLQNDLKDDEAIIFPYSNGNGYKAYQSVVYKENGNLIMGCGLGFKSELIKKGGEIEETQEQDESIARANASDMLGMVS